MTPTIREISVPNDLNEIPVSPRLAALIKEASTKEWETLFKFIRLSLANRISTTPIEELQTLQGKIKAIDDISSFFSKIISEKVANFR